jgi:hypothetical protein
MSSAATTSKADDATKSTEPPKEGDQTLPHLSVLEEDDEFEEFVVQGEPDLPPFPRIHAKYTRIRLLLTYLSVTPTELRLG